MSVCSVDFPQRPKKEEGRKKERKKGLVMVYLYTYPSFIDAIHPTPHESHNQTISLRVVKAAGRDTE